MRIILQFFEFCRIFLFLLIPFIKANELKKNSEFTEIYIYHVRNNQMITMKQWINISMKRRIFMKNHRRIVQLIYHRIFGKKISKIYIFQNFSQVFAFFFSLYFFLYFYFIFIFFILFFKFKKSYKKNKKEIYKITRFIEEIYNIRKWHYIFDNVNFPIN